MVPLLKRWRYTGVGIVVGFLAVAVWIATFAPHGGVELSAYLFPVARLLLGIIFPQQSIPPLVWFGSMLLHWPLIGFVMDLIRGRWVRRDPSVSR